MALRMSAALRNARNDAITTAIGTSGLIKFYAGTQPATGGTVTTLLADCTLTAAAAPAASAGVLTFNAITGDTSINNTGTVSWARITTSGGTFVMDLTVTATGGGGDMTTPSTSWVQLEPLTVSSLVITDGNP